MVRPRSEDKRNAILDGATRVIARQGLGATTAAIAKEAGVSNGSLFVYFETKAALVNELYVQLKAEMGRVAINDLPVQTDARSQMHHMWTQWVQWATTNPDKRRALAQLEVAEEITADSLRTVRESQAGMIQVLECARTGGPMRDVQQEFLLTMASSMANATMDAIIRDPSGGDDRAEVAFEAIWRALAG